MKASPSLPLRRCSRFLARFARSEERGATAVEFAFVAIPFLMLLFGIIELGMIFLISTGLENAVNDTARGIRTGEFQTGSTPTQQYFATQICANATMSWLGANCANNLNIDVRTYAEFAAINAPNPVSNNTLNKAALTFTPGGPNDIVLVRAFYVWTLIAPGLDGVIQQLSNGQMLITAATTFRNEPYQ